MSKLGSAGRRAMMAAAAIAVSATSAIASEITGNGKVVEINGRSECAYSGLNDTPEGDFMDPGGIVQSYGFFSGYWDLWDAEDFDPREDFLKPGFACNPNRGADLHGD